MNQDNQEGLRHRLDFVIRHLFNVNVKDEKDVNEKDGEEPTMVQVANFLGSQRGQTAEVLRGDTELGEKRMSQWASRAGVSATWLKDGAPDLAPPWAADFNTLFSRLRDSVKASPPGFANNKDFTNTPLHLAIEVQAARHTEIVDGEHAFNVRLRELASSGRALVLDKVNREHPTPDIALAAFMAYGRNTSTIGTLGTADLALLIMALSDALGGNTDDPPTPMGTLGLLRLFLSEFRRQTAADAAPLPLAQQIQLVIEVYLLLREVARKAWAS